MSCWKFDTNKNWTAGSPRRHDLVLELTDRRQISSQLKRSTSVSAAAPWTAIGLGGYGRQSALASLGRLMRLYFCCFVRKNCDPQSTPPQTAFGPDHRYHDGANRSLAAGDGGTSPNITSNNLPGPRLWAIVRLLWAVGRHCGPFGAFHLRGPVWARNFIGGVPRWPVPKSGPECPRPI